MCLFHSVQIKVNGVNFQSFEHCMPFSMVDNLEVNGDVEIFSTAYRRSAVSSAERRFSLALTTGADDDLDCFTGLS